MASLTQSWEGWDYFDDGTVIDNTTGAYYFQGEKVWSPSGTGIGDAVNNFAGLGAGVLDFAKAALGAWGGIEQAKLGLQSRTQQAPMLGPDGRYYLEGRPMTGLPMGAGASPGGSNPLLLLLGVGVLVLLLK